MKIRLVFAIAVISLLTRATWAQNFIPTSGNQFWNVDANWDSFPAPFPNSSGVATVIPAATGTLTIDLGQSITVGSLAINKSSGDFTTTIGVGTTNSLTFDGGTSTLLNGNSTTATGLTTIAAPVIFGPAMSSSTFTVTQAGSNTLEFTGGMSGTGNLSINRDSNGNGVIALNAANSYSGNMTITGSTGDTWAIVRLNNANAIPASSNISMLSSAILELAAGDFTRAIGTGAGQIQFGGTARNGWSAFGADRAVNLGGNLDPITYSVANFSQLVLGTTTATAMVDFQNPLVLDGTSTRIIRSYDNTAVTTEGGKISGNISGTGGINKQSDGVLSLAGNNSFSGITQVQGGMLRLDSADADSPNSNIQVGSGAILGIGADTAPADATADFARDLGTAAGQIQLIAIGGGGNAANAGFSAHNGNRSVVLSSGATLTWGTASFLSGGTGANRNFILSADTADGTLDFKNPINLNGAVRTVVAKNGSANIDARLSGVISGDSASGLIKDNPGTLELSNANTYGGVTRVTGGGVLLLTNANSIPGGINGGNTANIEINSASPTNIGVIGLGNGDLTSPLGSGPGQFQIIGSGGFAAYGANRTVNLGGASQQVVWGGANFIDPVAGRLALSTSGADATVDFQNPIDLNGAALRSIATRNGSADIDAVLSGTLSGAGSSIDKQGGGTLKLTGANTYDGGTFMNEGRLLVSNTTGSGTGSGAVAVNAGTLGGTGSISGAVTVASGAHIAPGESIESLDVGSLTVNTGSFLDFELGAPGSPGVTSDLINVTATDGLTVNGGTVNLTNAGGLASGTYTLIDYSGNLSGGVGLMTLGTQPAGFSYSLVNNPGNSSIDLQVNAVSLPGDFNSDGKVDAGDYVTWRKNNGTNNALANDNGLGVPIGPAHYNLWRANFGNPPGSGSEGGLGDAGTVPEPAAWVLLCLFVPLVGSRRFGRVGG